MHPAFSVIFLTTLIGVGQGLFLALFGAQFYGLMGLWPEPDSAFFFAVGSALALGFLVLGLIASFFHLGHPERAWRSAARWRTSWLSREVIALPALMGLVFLYGLIHWFGWSQPLFSVADVLSVDLSLLAGVLGVAMCFVLFVCTGMIYAAIKFLQEWHSPLTVANYTLLGIASGTTLAATLATLLADDLAGLYGGWAMVFTALALLSRGASLIRNRRLRPKSNLQTAIGVRHSTIVQKAQGFMGGSFNTREYFHGRSEAFVGLMMWLFLILVFAMPLILLALAALADWPVLYLIAFVSQYLGMLAERWHFFADARHPQNLYYQSMT